MGGYKEAMMNSVPHNSFVWGRESPSPPPPPPPPEEQPAPTPTIVKKKMKKKRKTLRSTIRLLKEAAAAAAAQEEEEEDEPLPPPNLFPWDYGDVTTWGLTEGDLRQLRKGGRDWLFGVTEEHKAQTRLYGAVLAMFFDKGGYDLFWWNSPTPNPGTDTGWSIIDNNLWIGAPTDWHRIPQRMESMTAIQLWAARTLMYHTLVGYLLRDLSLGAHTSRSIEQLTFNSIARSSQALSLHMGLKWFPGEEFPQPTSRGPLPWTVVQELIK